MIEYCSDVTLFFFYFSRLPVSCQGPFLGQVYQVGGYCVVVESSRLWVLGAGFHV